MLVCSVDHGLSKSTLASQNKIGLHILFCQCICSESWERIRSSQGESRMMFHESKPPPFPNKWISVPPYLLYSLADNHYHLSFRFSPTYSNTWIKKVASSSSSAFLPCWLAAGRLSYVYTNLFCAVSARFLFSIFGSNYKLLASCLLSSYFPATWQVL